MWDKVLGIFDKLKLLFAYLTGLVAGKTIGRLKAENKAKDGQIEVQKARVIKLEKRHEIENQVREKFRRMRRDALVSSPSVQSNSEEPAIKLSDTDNDELRLDRD